MKKILALLWILGALGASAYAECGYFRVSTHLLKCSAVDAKAARAGDLYQAPSDAPELEERHDQILAQITCECAYSLSGSDLRCDMDQTIERSSVIGAESASAPCRRGRSLCSDVCPLQLP